MAPRMEYRTGALLGSIRGIGTLPRLLWSEWERIHARECGSPAPLSRTPLVALASAVVFLALLEYFGRAPHFGPWLAALEGGGGGLGRWAGGVRRGPYLELWSCAYWAFSCCVCYLLLPALVVRLALKERLAGYGLSPRGALGHGGAYLALYLAVLPLVVLASLGAGFQRTYPFYSQAGRSGFDFVAFELGRSPDPRGGGAHHGRALALAAERDLRTLATRPSGGGSGRREALKDFTR